MSPPDVAARLPYPGDDDPAAVASLAVALGEALRVSDRAAQEAGTAHTAILAAWQAAEADVADSRTRALIDQVGMLGSGLAAAVPAVDVHAGELTAARRLVDDRRTEWADAARRLDALVDL